MNPSNESKALQIKCPFCAELISNEAKKCKHCGSFLPEKKALKKIVKLLGVLFLLFLATCGYICNRLANTPATNPDENMTLEDWKLHRKKIEALAQRLSHAKNIYELHNVAGSVKAATSRNVCKPSGCSQLHAYSRELEEISEDGVITPKEADSLKLSMQIFREALNQAEARLEKGIGGKK